MIHYWISSDKISNLIFIPKYYNPDLNTSIINLNKTHKCITVKELIDDNIIELSTGNEIGKSAYGTGDIPFVRTSDISNWEIKSIPKQGVSEEIYNQYAETQDVQLDDILFVRDGTYLIGNNCLVTSIDKEILYQSHILKIRVNNRDWLNPYTLFLLLNSSIVQKQIRSFQFTADIIDTIGQRFNEIVLPIPQNKDLLEKANTACRQALSIRMSGKAFIKHCPRLIEETLLSGSTSVIDLYLKNSIQEKVDLAKNETITAEFGYFTAFWKQSSEIVNNIYLPKYYDITINQELQELKKHSDLYSINDLCSKEMLEFHTGDEIGKMEYGTGEIPFIRTSDFANWEIYHNPKQGVSQEVYEKYCELEDVKENDILLVRDGTYLIGTSCIITKHDSTMLFCGGLIKFRLLTDYLDPFLFLGLLNSYIVKRQIRTKQFTRDVIDTIGHRIGEVIVPIPKSKQVRKLISQSINHVVSNRVSARNEIKELANILIT